MFLSFRANFSVEAKNTRPKKAYLDLTCRYLGTDFELRRRGYPDKLEMSLCKEMAGFISLNSFKDITWNSESL
jgi:hypothetical protein